MKRSKAILCLVTVISLLLNAIWPCQVMAVDVPGLASLGQLRTPGMSTPGALDADSGPDAAGNLFVAEISNGRVYKFDQYGSLMATFDAGGNGAGLALNADSSRLYVAQTQSVAILDTVSGAKLGSLTGVEFESVREIDLDSSGNVFVVDSFAKVVKVFNKAGNYLYSVNGAGANTGPFQQIGSMTVSPSNQLIVVDNDATNALVYVLTFGLDSNFEPILSGIESYSRTTAFDVPTKTTKTPLFVSDGVAYDHFSRAYFFESFRSEIRVLDAGFAYLSTYANTETAPGLLSNIKDAAFDAVNKRLFISCGGGRIEVFGIDGSLSPVHVNEAPSVPGTLSPAAGSETSANPTLIITNATDDDGDALTYRVVVSQDGAMVFEADVDEDPAGGETTSVTVDTVTLTENTAYSWTVQAFDNETSSAESFSANFVVNAVDDPPSTPELVAPLDGASADGLDAMIWGQSLDPDPNDSEISYQITIALDEAFGQVVATESTTATALVLGGFADYAELVDGTGYFWRVVALDDDETASDASATGQFVYDTTSLTITANMPDAKVFLLGNHGFSGREIGVAPLELRDFPAGIFSVVVERSGFEPFVAQVSLAEQGRADLYAKLVPAMETNSLVVRARSINGRTGLTVDGKASPFLVDFDSDGLLDLLVGDAAGQINLYPALEVTTRGGLVFQPGITLDLPVLPGAVPFVADWDNDGRKDLLVGAADGSVKLFLNLGLEEAPAFGLGADLSAGGSALNVGANAAPAVIDYNNDGAKDLLVGNAAGQIQLCLNLNDDSDAAPQLAAPVEILLVGSSAVPFPVDWDADGQKDLQVTSGGQVTVYSQVDGVYLPTEEFSDRKIPFHAAFPIDLTGDKGKELLVGDVSGQMNYMTGSNNAYVESFSAALMSKVDELAELVAIEAFELLPAVVAIGTLVDAGDYGVVKENAKLLVLQLVAGPAQDSAAELAGLF